MAGINDFERFDVVSDNSDHYFDYYVRRGPSEKNNKKRKDNDVDGAERFVPNCFTNTSCDVYKRIMKEWKILARNIPDSIYVRVYENRIYLLRAMIVGAAGTPYHDGLFWFDIAFPPDYPARPPKVYYHSYGLKVNPNMHSTGAVCLSLINTWKGKKNEQWDPSGGSTILQLLVSLQGLVLNDLPFFNEVGSEILGRTIREKQAYGYNDVVFAVNCKTMLYMLQRPPQHFQAFVTSHFRDRASAILSACNDYVNGRVRVGHYGVNEGAGLCRSVKVSAKFKEDMGVLYPKMLEAFMQSGAVLESDLQSLKFEERSSSSKHKKYKVIARRMVGKIRKFYASTRAKIDGPKQVTTTQSSASYLQLQNH